MIAILVPFPLYVAWRLYAFYKRIPWNERKTCRDITPKDKFHISVVNIGYLMYPTLCLQAFALFNCRYVGETLYLSADLEVQCFTGYHLTMVVVFGGIQIVGFVIGMPIFLYVMLKKKNKQNKLSHAKNTTRFGLFYIMYKENRWYWEIFIVARKVFVVLLLGLGSLISVQIQILLCMLVLAIAIVFEILGQPYEILLLSRMEILVLIVCYLTLWSGLMIFEVKNDSMHEILSIFIVVINVCTMIWLVGKLVAAKCSENKSSKLIAKAKAVGRRSRTSIQESAAFLSIVSVFSSKTSSVNSVEQINPVFKKSDHQMSLVVSSSVELTPVNSVQVKLVEVDNEVDNDEIKI